MLTGVSSTIRMRGDSLTPSSAGPAGLPASDESYPRGFTQVSDQARQALDPCRSPRISAQGLPSAKRPLRLTWAPRAGKNVEKTPMGRLLKPGGALRTKLSMQRSEEHTSELQSLRHLVCRLL